MSAGEDLRARTRAIQSRDRAAAEPDPAPPPAVARTRPVRRTVDLSPDRYAALSSWQLDAALALGRTRITAQEVLATAIEVLLDDETVARRVRDRLARNSAAQ